MGQTGNTSTTAHIISSLRKSRQPHSTQDTTTTESESLVTLSSEISVHSDQEYPIKCILEESSDKYLIAWEGPYEPTWEPKHFANNAAIRVWNRKKTQLSAGNRPLQPNPLSSSSFVPSTSTSRSVLGSTVPESQQSAFSQSTAISCSTNSQLSSIPSQASILSGSLYCPDSSDQPTQSSGVASTQSQHQVLTRSHHQALSTQTIEESTFASQQQQSSTSLEPSSHCSVRIVRPTSGSELLNRLKRPTHQHRPVGAFSNISSISTFTNSFQPESTSRTTSEPVTSQRTVQRNSSLGYTQSSSNNASTILEIAETPQSRLRLQYSQNSSQSQLTQSTLSRTPIYISPYPPVGVADWPQTSSLAYQTPLRRVGGSSNGSRDTIPESLPQNISSQPSVPSQLSSKNNTRPPSNFAASPLQIMNDSTPNNRSPNPPLSMEEAIRSNPGTSFRDKMRFLRAHERSLAGQQQPVSSSATPSSAGDIEPVQSLPARDHASPLNVRVDKEPVHKEHVIPTTEAAPEFIAPQALHYTVENPVETAEALAEAQPNLAGPTELLETPLEPMEDHIQTLEHAAVAEESEIAHHGIQLGPYEFAIPVSMDSRVKDDYDIVLTAERNNIKRFLDEASSLGTSTISTSSEYDALVPKMGQMLEQLNNITVHPDLNLPDQPAVPAADPTKETAWAEYSSSKFQFLGYFIDEAANEDFHVIVVAKRARAVRIVENYLVGKGFTHIQRMIDTPNQLCLYRGQLSFAIRTTSDDRTMIPYKTPAAIIALDNSFDADNQTIQKLRTDFSPNENLLPVIRLLVSNTSEHIERSLPRLSELNRLRLLVKYTRELSNTAGEVQDDALDVQEYAQEVIKFFKRGSKIWSLPVVEAIPIEEASESPPILEPEQLRDMTASRQKRWLEGETEEDINPSKRQRTTPFQDITHISDSMKGQTQTQTQPQSQSPERPSQLSDRSIVQAQKALEEQVRQLQTALTSTQARLQQTESNFSRLQHRYETRHNEYHKMRTELDQALETSKKSADRLERQKAEIAKLKDEKSALAKDLEEARNTIKEGGGDAAALESALEEARKLNKENASLQRSVTQERSQSEYTRQQYQNASTAAATAAMELRQREEELEEMKSKASKDAEKLKLLRMKNDEQVHLARIAELETTLAGRDEMLNRKEEELRELKKNRPSTRATSLQPRSPKVGASRPASRPASPGPGVGATGGGGNHKGSALRFPF
ncbi:hypothetical protein FQN50_000555 [Emmonsiellopsis sp. PD_5]|nr:hypothetical protein FQN50_000555 [Emmonsiellopsis sp. PD_5]